MISRLIRTIVSRIRRPWRYWQIYWMITRVKPRKIMEVGTWTGDRARTMITLAKRYHDAEEIAYYGFDLFGQMTAEKFSEEKSKWPPARREADKKLRTTGAHINLFQGDTTQILPELTGGLPNMDLIFIDGGHSIETITSDWFWASKLMHDQTLVVFDDYWPGRMDAGCKATVDGIDRKAYSVTLGWLTDTFEKTAFGRLRIRLAIARKRKHPEQSLMHRIKKGLRRMKNMHALHGTVPVLSFYVGRLSPIKWFFQQLSLRWLIPVTIHGSRMYLDAHDPGISTMLLTEGTREPGHVDQVKGNITPGMTGIDLGSNIGYYALLEARLVGVGGKIYCIEPESKNLDLLRSNIKANGFEERFVVSQHLIGDRDGLAKLRLSPLSNRHSVALDGEGALVEVPMITLDTFMERNRVEPRDINFLRMDIEGYEVIAFQGMQRLMTAQTPLKIFIEFHPRWYGRWGWTFERFLDYLESFGFRVRSLAYKGDNAILTLRDPSREEIMATQIAPRTGSGGCHGFLERA